MESLVQLSRSQPSTSMLSPTSDELTIDVLLLDRSRDSLSIVWMGNKFSVATKDVVEISSSEVAMPNFGDGIPSKLKLRRDTNLQMTKHVVVEDVLNEMPFSLNRPSLSFPFEDKFSEREKEWFAFRELDGLLAPTASATTTYTATQSSQITATKTTTEMNDSKVDDTPQDAMSNDDQDADGLKSDDL